MRQGTLNNTRKETKMSLAQDLMGLGISPLQAAHTSQGGTGPLTLSLATNAAGFAGATALGAFQYCVSVTTSGSTSTCGVKLPTVGGDNGCLLADDFVINNAGATTISVFGSTSVTISVSGSNGSVTTLPIHTTMTVFPITTTQWIGVKGG